MENKKSKSNSPARAGKKSKKHEVKDEVALLKAQLVRALADYDNLTKRYSRDSEQFGTIARSQMLVGLIPAIDMIESAQAHLQDQGLAMGVATLLQSLREQGFEKLEPKVGTQFDAESHEVVEVVSEKEKENGEIVEVLLAGWRIKDGQVIRHAKVRVNRVENNKVKVKVKSKK